MSDDAVFFVALGGFAVSCAFPSPPAGISRGKRGGPLPRVRSLGACSDRSAYYRGVHAND